MKRIALLALFCAAAYALFYFCHKKTSGFQIAKIYSDLPADPRWNLFHSKEEIAILHEALQTPFYFLGKGGQTYAFSSQDGTLVLKLFKMHNLRQYPLAYRLFLPFPCESFRLKALLNQKKKLERMFSSSFLAYHSLKEESALLAMNLNPDHALQSVTVTLVDKLGIAHTLPLDRIPFALQKRGERAIYQLSLCIENRNTELGKKILDQIVMQIKARREKNLGDLDPCIRRNFGILPDRTPFFIDIGGFIPVEQRALPPIHQDTESLYAWLEARSPELTSYLKELLENNSSSPLQTE